MTGFYHRSVLLDEALELLDIRPGMTILDCTAGGGGHSLAMLEKAQPGGRLIALDQDEDALAAARARLEEAGPVSYTHLDVYKRQGHCLPEPEFTAG